MSAAANDIIATVPAEPSPLPRRAEELKQRLQTDVGLSRNQRKKKRKLLVKLLEASGLRASAASDGGLSSDGAASDDEDGSIFAPGGQASAFNSGIATSECDAISHAPGHKRQRMDQEPSSKKARTSNAQHSSAGAMLPPLTSLAAASATTAQVAQAQISLPASASASAAGAVPDTSAASVPMLSGASASKRRSPDHKAQRAASTNPLAAHQPSTAAPPMQLRGRGMDLSGVAALMSCALRHAQPALSAENTHSGSGGHSTHLLQQQGQVEQQAWRSYTLHQHGLVPPHAAVDVVQDACMEQPADVRAAHDTQGAAAAAQQQPASTKQQKSGSSMCQQAHAHAHEDGQGDRSMRHRYGNYHRYYGYRLKEAFDDDPRLKLMEREWFAGKHIIDVGCNEGFVTLAVAARFAPKRTTGFDIDASLKAKACRNLSLMRSELTQQLHAKSGAIATGGSSYAVHAALSGALNASAGMQPASHEQQQVLVALAGLQPLPKRSAKPAHTAFFDPGAKDSELLSASAGQDEGGSAAVGSTAGEVVQDPAGSTSAAAAAPEVAGAGGLGSSAGNTLGVPFHLLRSAVKALSSTTFVHQDWANARTKHEHADTIMCLSVTKWVQLNFGDDGLKRMFAKFYDTLTPGGLLVLEPQPWRSYKNAARKVTTSGVPFKRIDALELRPADFVSHLTTALGFEHVSTLAQGSQTTGAGFDRPMHLLRKPLILAPVGRSLSAVAACGATNTRTIQTVSSGGRGGAGGAGGSKDDERPAKANSAKANSVKANSASALPAEQTAAGSGGKYGLAKAAGSGSVGTGGSVGGGSGSRSQRGADSAAAGSADGTHMSRRQVRAWCAGMSYEQLVADDDGF